MRCVSAVQFAADDTSTTENLWWEEQPPTCAEDRDRLVVQRRPSKSRNITAMHLSAIPRTLAATERMTKWRSNFVTSTAISYFVYRAEERAILGGEEGSVKGWI